MPVWYVHSPRHEGAHILTHVSPSPCPPIPLHQWQWTLYPYLKLNILKQGCRWSMRWLSCVV